MSNPSDAAPSRPPSGAAGEPMAEVEFAVTGMHCDSCAALIEEVLAEQEGVHAASVDLEGARARVEYDSSRVGLEDLTEAVAEAGYSATPSGSG